jgi:hypothetical protein
MKVRPLALVALAGALAGCSQAGVPRVSLSEAARIGVATERIAVACGTAAELRAFAGPNPPGLKDQESIALSGTRKLAAVYAHDHSRIYQGESVGAVVHDSISLLKGCGLPTGQKALQRALGHDPSG